MLQSPQSSPSCDDSMRAQGLRMPRLCVSALSGGGGKTLLSLGLTHALAARGHAVKAFKKGPDYIDAAWLAMASGRPATNLDPYMLGADQLKALFVHAMYKTQAQTGCPEVLGVIEGNRGLFDGMDVAGSCSTAELARMLACPIILSINCTKMTRTTAALVHGMTTFEPGLQFAGVVLNQVGTARHEDLLRKVIEEYTDVRVLGGIGVVETHEPVNTQALQRYFVQHGVWIRPFNRLVYLMPPYITPAEDVAQLCTVVAGALRAGAHLMP